MKCPTCANPMRKGSYPVKGLRYAGWPFPCDIHYFCCKTCQIKIRRILVSEESFREYLNQDTARFKRERDRNDAMEKKLEVFRLESGDALKKLYQLREQLQKILRGLF